MFRTIRLLTSVLIVLASVSLAGAQKKIDVSGDWDMITSTPRGDMTTTLKFVQADEKLEVTMVSDFGEAKGEGTLKGNDIEWKVTMQTPNGDFTISYTGKVEGNTMSGEAQAGDFGTMAWKATKKTA